MKKTVLAVLFSSSLLFASNAISLTGEYAKQLGNPFRVLLEKKDKNISIFSENKEVIFKVESNLDNNSIYRVNHLQHPSTYVFNNKSVENVVKQFYGEEFNVVKSDSSADVVVNVLSGKVMIEYIDNQEQNQIPLLNKVKVELTLEIIKNGNRIEKTVLMDDKLGKENKKYEGIITYDDVKNLSIKSINKYILEIVENLIYITIKG